jgi:O-antigen ligase
MLCILICFVGLAAATTRSAIVGLSLAAGLSFVIADERGRFQIAVTGGILAGLVLIAALLPEGIPHMGILRSLYLGVSSAIGGVSVDATGAWRMTRWAVALRLWLCHPIFGAGFGTLLLPYSLDTDQFRTGLFNGGAPHNTYLFVLDRMGIVGFSLIIFCWVYSMRRLWKMVRMSHSPDALAALNILVAMAGFAAFVLFFERPVNNAPFWIILALGARLSEHPRLRARSFSLRQNRALQMVPLAPGY